MDLTLDQALQKGVEAHKAGKVQEADRYYTAILKSNPKHPDANHNMGVLAVGVGKVDQALPFFKTALEANPKIAQFWLSYVDALIKLNRMDDAKSIFDKAKSHGAKGDGFDKLEQKLGGLEKGPEVDAGTSILHEPPEDHLERLINLYTKTQYQEALIQASYLLKQFPNSINLCNIIGAANKGLGKLEEAIEIYNKALLIRPDFVEAHYNMGNALKDQGKLDEAIEAYTKAISLKPEYAQAFVNMGLALQDKGMLNAAIDAYNHGLSLKPGNYKANYNKANALKELGMLDEAIEAYNKALILKPDYAEAFNNMGIVLKDQGRLDEALEAYNKAVLIKPDFRESYYNICNALKGISLQKPNKALQDIITLILDKQNYVRPKDIAKAALSLLKFEPNLIKYLKLADDAEIKKPLDVVSDLNELPLLFKLMSVCAIPDLEVERIFKKLRSAILKDISNKKIASPALLRFLSALALQCFTNEYIFNHAHEEEKHLRALEKVVKQAFKNNEQPYPHEILILASYKPLYQYEWCTLLLTTDHIEEVITRQIKEPQKEKELEPLLPILGEITDNVSSKVRQQYEESPYPRWVDLGQHPKPMSTSKLFNEYKLKLHDNKVTEVEKPDILIAGCGTGQHSIGTATSFKSSKVVAIDLSRSSLAYANRKTEELGIKNIDYIHADILDLTKLDRQFDIIESAGVLHHMADPMKGWKILTDCLKPGGLMLIGLYSELARRHIVSINQEIRAQNIGSSDEEMKLFRDIIIRSDEDHHKLITKSSDFYSLSTLRDLLFHVQEHRFTIPKIKDYLDELGLKFSGFQNKKIVLHFKQINPKKDAHYDLDEWQEFEEAHPRAFIEMYQFWCQKVV